MTHKKNFQTRPSKQCKSLIDALILRQYLEKKSLFVEKMKNGQEKKESKGHMIALGLYRALLKGDHL